MRRATRLRAATIVEYALLLVAVMLVVAGSYKLLGAKLAKRSDRTGDVVSGEGAGTGGGGAGGGRSKGGGGGGGSGGGGGGDKPTVASKMTMSGIGGAEAAQGGGAATPPAASTSTDAPPAGDVASENMAPKRWVGIGLLGAGVFAFFYVVVTMRRAKKRGAALGPGVND